MQRLGSVALGAARLLISAWTGAAILFVVTAVAEVMSPDLDSTTKDLLAGIRFPLFYRFGAVCLAGGIVATMAAIASGVLSRGGGGVIAGLLVLAAALMTVDYFSVFLPLMEMITPPGQVRPAEFVDLHRMSARVNGVELVLVLVAALALNSRCEVRPVASEQGDGP